MIPDNISDEGFDLMGRGPAEGYEPPRARPDRMQAWMADEAVWANYEDAELADIEQALREWGLAMCREPAWRSRRNRRYTMGMCFECLYGRKYTKDDYSAGIKLSTLLGYYASKVQRGGTIRNKRHNNKIYCISMTRLKKAAPYSIRLRARWLDELGRTLTQRRMRVLDDEVVRPGHARAAKADERMQERRRSGRGYYDSYIRRIAKGSGEGAEAL